MSEPTGAAEGRDGGLKPNVDPGLRPAPAGSPAGESTSVSSVPGGAADAVPQPLTEEQLVETLIALKRRQYARACSTPSQQGLEAYVSASLEGVLVVGLKFLPEFRDVLIAHVAYLSKEEGKQP